MNSYSVADYQDAGCSLMNSPNRGMLLAVHELAGGKLCDTGCADFNKGKCLAYRNLLGAVVSGATINPSAPIESVRDEAARRGVSLSEVRRNRALAA